jgi:hypothetical protein
MSFKTYLEQKLIGGQADKHSLESIAKKHGVSLKLIQKEFEMGMSVEKEHTDDVEIAKEVAMDHLVELPDYYTRLKKMEEE